MNLSAVIGGIHKRPESDGKDLKTVPPDTRYCYSFLTSVRQRGFQFTFSVQVVHILTSQKHYIHGQILHLISVTLLCRRTSQTLPTLGTPHLLQTLNSHSDFSVCTTALLLYVAVHTVSVTLYYLPYTYLFFISMLKLYQFFNLLKPTGHVMHQQFNIQQLYVLPTLYLCVLYLSENKQRLVPLTA